MSSMLNLPLFEFLSGQQNIFYFGLSQFVLSTPIILLHRELLKKGWLNLIKKRANMDSLVFIGSITAYLFGVFSVVVLFFAVKNQNIDLIEKYHHNLYFESGAGILFFVTLGKYFEAKSKKNTADSIKKLLNLMPEEALIYNAEHQDYLKMSVDKIKLNDLIMVKAGMKIPCDGKIVEGESSVDESFLTGESLPVLKTLQQTVYASSVNLNGTIIVKCEKENRHSMLSQIIDLVEEAANSKAVISRIADKISRYFVPLILLLSAVTFFIWIFIKRDFSFSIERAISVLVISCPCALGLATPLSIMRGTKLLVERHILVKSGEAIEGIGKIDTVLLDKTGTVTKGYPEVVEIKGIGFTKEKVITLAYALESQSTHPISNAVINYAKELDLIKLPVKSFMNYSGKGVSGIIDQNYYYIGNKMFMQENQVSLSNLNFDENKNITTIFLAENREIIGIISIKDELKNNAESAVLALKNIFKEVYLISGDHKNVVEVTASKLGIEKYFYETLPIEKSQIIKELQQKNHRVMMIGDGINDSLSLINADIGISFKNGSDIAVDASDFVLIKNDLSDVITTYEICQKIIRNIKFNFFWAFIYNLIFIFIAMGGLYSFNILLNPMFASIAMSLSSICVVFNSLMLNYKK